MSLYATTGGVPVVNGGDPIVLPYDFIDTFKRSNGPVGNGWSDINDLWPTSFDSAPIIDQTWGSTSTNIIDGGNTLIYRETGLSDNFHIVCRWVVEDDPPVSTLNQNGVAAFIDPEAPINDLYMGILTVSDFTINRYYINNIANCSAKVFNDNYMTMSLIYGDLLPALALPPGFVLPNPAYATYELRVVGGEMVGYANGRAFGDPSPIPAEHVGRTIHGFGARTGSFPVSRVGVMWFIEPYTGSF